MNRPPTWPFHDETDALDALMHGTFWERISRWAAHMGAWCDTPRPPLGAPRHTDEKAA